MARVIFTSLLVRVSFKIKSTLPAIRNFEVEINDRPIQNFGNSSNMTGSALSLKSHKLRWIVVNRIGAFIFKTSPVSKYATDITKFICLLLIVLNLWEILSTNCIKTITNKFNYTLNGDIIFSDNLNSIIIFRTTVLKNADGVIFLDNE